MHMLEHLACIAFTPSLASVFGLHIGLGLLFAGTIAVFAFGWPLLVIIALPLFVLSQAIFIALAFFFRCPSCRHFVFAQ